MTEVDDIPDLELFINKEVLFPHNWEYMKASKVIGRITYRDGKPVGTYRRNTITNTRFYDMMFPDRETQKYSENVIAENLYIQLDEEGHSYTLMY